MKKQGGCPRRSSGARTMEHTAAHRTKHKRGAGRIRYYKHYTDDFVHGGSRDYKLPDDYVWLDERAAVRAASSMIYAAARIFAFLYVRLWRHIRVKNKNVLRQCRDSGCFLYGNHTQPVGDVFIPGYICGSKRIYTIAEQENMGLPVIGRILPLLGALPVPDTFSQMKRFLEAVQTRICGKCCVVVYPEAHVWPYCAKIRPFPLTSFKFPVDYGVPSFCMTVTYRKMHLRKRPGITVYIDGPFYPDQTLGRREAQRKLHDDISRCMKKRSRGSYEYIRYREEKKP